MSMLESSASRRFVLPPHLLLLLALPIAACGAESDDATENHDERTSDLSPAQKLPRYSLIRDVARFRGIHSNGFLLAGISNEESGLAHCWSEATWACKGPGSPDCGGGPVIAGSADGPCSANQGGLGMFQFDAGTYSNTVNKYGQEILTVGGQVSSAVDYAVQMVKNSIYTTNAETDAKALAWLNDFDVDNGTLRDQWIKTVLRYYNGCQPGWSCWAPRYQAYTDGMWMAVDEPGGLGFWSDGGGTSCNGSPAAVGAIEDKYLELGGCGSFLGAPTTPEKAAPDGVGRYSVFQHGSIYWTPKLGAHEVHGKIRDKWAELGWEQSSLGYPISDEYPVPVGSRSDFEHGSITWDAAKQQVTVEAAASSGPHWKVLDVDYQAQSTGYWCGPAATRMALSARLDPPSQATLASELGTTTNGTDWIGQVTETLNDHVGQRYATTEMPNDPPSQSQRDKLWNDIVLSINNNYPIVANIVAPPSNHPPGYPNNKTIYHYFAVIGYNPDTSQVYIADSANFGGNKLYWLSFDQLATLIPPKGYSAYKCPTGLTGGAIHTKFQALGGCSSVVGGPVTAELKAPDGVGRYNVFEIGSIYWTADTGAHEVHGAIRDRWGDEGWENGALGYPTSDEYGVPEGRRSDFEGGSIVWNASTFQTSIVAP
jgi:hypothetical protein